MQDVNSEWLIVRWWCQGRELVLRHGQYIKDFSLTLFIFINVVLREWMKISQLLDVNIYRKFSTVIQNPILQFCQPFAHVPMHYSLNIWSYHKSAYTRTITFKRRFACSHIVWAIAHQDNRTLGVLLNLTVKARAGRIACSVIADRENMLIGLCDGSGSAILSSYLTRTYLAIVSRSAR